MYNDITRKFYEHELITRDAFSAYNILSFN